MGHAGWLARDGFQKNKSRKSQAVGLTLETAIFEKQETGEVATLFTACADGKTFEAWPVCGVQNIKDYFVHELVRMLLPECESTQVPSGHPPMPHLEKRKSQVGGYRSLMAGIASIKGKAYYGK